MSTTDNKSSTEVGGRNINVPAWAARLPAPQSQPAWIDPSEVEELIRSRKAGVDFLIVDVRRDDAKVC